MVESNTAGRKMVDSLILKSEAAPMAAFHGFAMWKN
jgi:hypothetical protein